MASKSKLTVEATTQPRQGYNGKMNIGIKSSNGNWVKCEKRELWPLFVKGAVLEVLVEADGSNLTIIDAVGKEAVELKPETIFSEPETEKAVRLSVGEAGQLERIEKTVTAIAKRVEELTIGLAEADEKRSN